MAKEAPTPIAAEDGGRKLHLAPPGPLTAMPKPARNARGRCGGSPCA